MTNSQTSSSNDEYIIGVLTSFLEGHLTFSNLKVLLKEDILIDFDLAPDIRKIQELNINTNIQIQVNKENLCQILRKYISNEISDLEISNWAAFIFMMPFFTPEGKTEEECWRAGEEPLWEIIHKLATPSIYGGISLAIAQNYLYILSCGS